MLASSTGYDAKLTPVVENESGEEASEFSSENQSEAAEMQHVRWTIPIQSELQRIDDWLSRNSKRSQSCADLDAEAEAHKPALGLK